MKKYSIVNQETCIACGTCASIAPEIFANNDLGYSYVIIDDNKGVGEIPGEYHDDLEDAEESCPSDSIKVDIVPLKLFEMEN